MTQLVTDTPSKPVVDTLEPDMEPRPAMARFATAIRIGPVPTAALAHP